MGESLCAAIFVVSRCWKGDYMGSRRKDSLLVISSRNAWQVFIANSAILFIESI